MAQPHRLNEYYQNGPLPTWIGWYVQQLPQWFHVVSAGGTLVMELGLVWLVLLPGRWRVACFWMVTAWQAIVIATANYAFLNYLVLTLAFLLLSDDLLCRFIPSRWRAPLNNHAIACESLTFETSPDQKRISASPALRSISRSVGTVAHAFVLAWYLYATLVPLLRMFTREVPLSLRPLTLLQPFRIANEYGPFAVMTAHRYEIEFQGSNDGQTWTAYRFLYKPQAIDVRPRIYAPYQPRFDWNLWFASLGQWEENQFVVRTEESLLENNCDVLSLFGDSPFSERPPRMVRTILWQYWFTSVEQKRSSGAWWRRQFLGTYSPTLARMPDGRFGILADASLSGPPPS